MSIRHHVIALAFSLVLAGCGGSGGSAGGGAIASSPIKAPPPPPPPPLNYAGVSLMDDATGTSTLVYAGASLSSAATPVGPSLEVRYNATIGAYEVRLPEGSFQPLYVSPASSTLDYFETASPLIRVHRADIIDNTASTILSWSAWGTATYHGFTAVGVAAGPGDIPVTGTASYAGLVAGLSNEPGPTGPWDDGSIAGVGGTIAMAFNFGLGTLGGSVSLSAGGSTPTDIGTIAFRDTVYSTGSATFSGAFDTSVAGANSFTGTLVGAGAKEAIGAFAVPYVSAGDGKIYQAQGAFIAKK